MKIRNYKSSIKLLTISWLCIFLITSCAQNKKAGGTSDQAWKQVAGILEKIQPPVFPDREFDITAYGAPDDGKRDAKSALDSAIQACSKAGGGKVIVPAGTYKINGPIHLQSNINLHLEEGSRLLFGVEPEDYLPPVLVRWEGTRCYNYSPLIYAYQEKNIAITGKGVIDGQTEKFWYLWKLIHDRDKQILRQMGKNLKPVEDRVFGKGHYLRPTLIEPYECENVLIQGVTVKSSPFWTIHPVLCTNVTIRNVRVKKGKSNDDGCNPESCKNVLIENCTFSSNDDNIAIKAGRDNDAWVKNGGRPSENIIIRNNEFGGTRGGAITIGSEMSGGVRNIFAEDNIVGNVKRAYYIKSNTDRGGSVKDIYYRDTQIENCRGAVIRVLLGYKGATAGEYPADFDGFYFENISCGRAETGFKLTGLPEKSIRNILLRDIRIERVEKDMDIYFAENIDFRNVKIDTFRTAQADIEALRDSHEESPDRLTWEDLPGAVQNSFLDVFSEIVNSKNQVSRKARQNVINVFNKDPMLNAIGTETRDDQRIYRLHKSFGSEHIRVVVREDGRILAK